MGFYHSLLNCFINFASIFMSKIYLFLIAACAAAKRAIGTRNGEHDT